MIRSVIASELFPIPPIKAPSMLQKYRVFCPHCAASLLVTEDLMGTQADCPGCKEPFLLPSIDELTADPPEEEVVAAAELPAVPEAAAETPHTVPPIPLRESLAQGASSHAPRRTAKPVKIEKRTELRFFSSLLKVVSLLLLLISCGMLITTVVSSIQAHPGTAAVLMSIGTSMLIGVAAVPAYAFAELILVFAAQEEMLRHILNELRTRE